MARALIVGCGCRGRTLASRLAAEGWTVRGTTRERAGLAAIESAGLEAALADPARPGTILDLVGDVTVLHWLLASAGGEGVDALHGDSLEALLERLVDTPVRGFVYEAAGRVPDRSLWRGTALVRLAARRWRIPVEVVDADPLEPEAWAAEMHAATRRVIGRR